MIVGLFTFNVATSYRIGVIYGLCLVYNTEYDIDYFYRSKKLKQIIIRVLDEAGFPYLWTRNIGYLYLIILFILVIYVVAAEKGDSALNFDQR